MIQSKLEKLQKDWLKRHTLTPEQRKQLIQDKMDRAREQSKRLNKTIGKFSW
jgi:polyhydroxyalkanoate synthesis regulator phasin